MVSSWNDDGFWRNTKVSLGKILSCETSDPNYYEMGDFLPAHHGKTYCPMIAISCVEVVVGIFLPKISLSLCFYITRNGKESKCSKSRKNIEVHVMFLGNSTRI